MALQKTMSIGQSAKSLLTIPNAYIRIDAFRYDKPDRAWVCFGVYNSKDHADSDDKEHTQIEHTYSMQEDLGGKANVNMEKLYIKAKELAIFAGALDV